MVVVVKTALKVVETFRLIIFYTFNISLPESYRPISKPPLISKMLKIKVLEQLLAAVCPHRDSALKMTF